MLLMSAMAVHADPISQATAASKAKAFFANRKAASTADPHMVLQGRQRVLGKSPKVSNSYYYVFNNGNNDGLSSSVAMTAPLPFSVMPTAAVSMPPTCPTTCRHGSMAMLSR